MGLGSDARTCTQSRRLPPTRAPVSVCASISARAAARNHGTWAARLASTTPLCRRLCVACVRVAVRRASRAAREVGLLDVTVARSQALRAVCAFGGRFCCSRAQRVREDGPRVARHPRGGPALRRGVRHRALDVWVGSVAPVCPRLRRVAWPCVWSLRRRRR